MLLADRYHELLALRTEGLTKYRANVLGTLRAPPGRAYWPRLSLDGQVFRGSRLGPITVLDRPPIWRYVEAVVAAAQKPLSILEFGPGTGDLTTYLRSRFGDKVGRYFGVERDKNVAGTYESIASASDVPVPIDLIVASEVIEHMSADDFYSDVLVPMRGHLSPNAQLVLSTPNPISPGGIARDFSHVQNYPWYDLYAILRLEFSAVDVHRTLYAWTLQRMLCLAPRIALCTMMELDWCDGLVCVARTPRNGSG